MKFISYRPGANGIILSEVMIFPEEIFPKGNFITDDISPRKISSMKSLQELTI
jgi:hypothetical protein